MLTNQTYEKKKYVRMSDADHFRTFTNQNVLIVLALPWACCGLVHTLLYEPTLASDQIPRFFSQVDLVWKKMKSQYDARAVAELNKELRYIVSFSAILQL